MLSDSPQIVVIAAITQNRVLGLKGRMPWHLPPDLQHFKSTTMGRRMVMGHTTFLGFGRLLPGREHIVLTRSQHTSANSALKYVPDLDTALDFSRCPPLLPETQTDTIFVIGGAQIYALALANPKVKHAILTHIDLACEGDAFFPALGPEWAVVSESKAAEYEGLGYRFVHYERD